MAACGKTKKTLMWAAAEKGKHLCVCGCGRYIKVKWFHFYGGIPRYIKGHSRTKRHLACAQWIEDNQGRHFCHCGCGEPIKIQIHHHTRGIPEYIDGHCSRVRNAMSGQFGEKNPHYKGGRVIRGGYVLILIPGPGRSKYIFEHRAKLEKKLGRRLTRSEVVHHKNGNKADNRLANLKLINNSDHSRYHTQRGDSGFRSPNHPKWKKHRHLQS